VDRAKYEKAGGGGKMRGGGKEEGGRRGRKGGGVQQNRGEKETGETEGEEVLVKVQTAQTAEGQGGPHRLAT